MQLRLSRQLLTLSLCLCAFSGALLAQKIQINPEAQQKAFADARALVPDTLQWDFSQVKEIYLDEFAILNEFEDGMLCIQDVVTGKCGFLNEEGEWAIPLSLYLAGRPNEAPYFHNGYCVCRLKNANNKYDWIILSKTGKTVKLPHVIHCSDFSNAGYALAIKEVMIDKYQTRFKVVFINPLGQEIMPDIYGNKLHKEMPDRRFLDAYDMNDGLALYYDFVADRWGYFDKNGRKVIPAKYQSAHEFSEGLAAVQLPMDSDAPMKWGYISTKGQWTIPPRFSNQPDDFSDGLALVQKTNELFVYINPQGQVVSQDYERATPFYHGYAFVRDTQRYTHYCVNTSFEVVNNNEECFIQDDAYFWNGRKVYLYNASLGTYDFVGRHVIVKGWKYKDIQGDGGRMGAFQITSHPMVRANNDTFFGDPIRWAFFADLTGKVKFAIYLNEF